MGVSLLVEGAQSSTASARTTRTEEKVVPDAAMSKDWRQDLVKAPTLDMQFNVFTADICFLS
jgi:hypothetical protein